MRGLPALYQPQGMGGSPDLTLSSSVHFPIHATHFNREISLEIAFACSRIIHISPGSDGGCIRQFDVSPSPLLYAFVPNCCSRPTTPQTPYKCIFVGAGGRWEVRGFCAEDTCDFQRTMWHTAQHNWETLSMACGFRERFDLPKLNCPTMPPLSNYSPWNVP